MLRYCLHHALGGALHRLCKPVVIHPGRRQWFTCWPHPAVKHALVHLSVNNFPAVDDFRHVRARVEIYRGIPHHISNNVP